MKKVLSIIFLVGMAITTTASAQGGMMGYPAETQKSTTILAPDATAIHAALQEIYASQNVTDQQQIICAKVTDEQLIKLGDAVMGYGITEEQHTAMENMMGGEESPMSKQAHENMGRSYLGCWANYNSGPMMMMSTMGNSSSGSVLPSDTQGARYSGGYGGMMGG